MTLSLFTGGITFNFNKKVEKKTGKKMAHHQDLSSPLYIHQYCIVNDLVCTAEINIFPLLSLITMQKQSSFKETWTFIFFSAHCSAYLAELFTHFFNNIHVIRQQLPQVIADKADAAIPFTLCQCVCTCCSRWWIHDPHNNSTQHISQTAPKIDPRGHKHYYH